MLFLSNGSKVSLNYPQAMGTFSAGLINNAGIIDRIYTNAARSMNDLMVIQQHAYMINSPFTIIKKSQVATACLL
jgi:hypothetical protein